MDYRVNTNAFSNVRDEQGTVNKNAVRTGGKSCPPGTIARKTYKRRGKGYSRRTIRVHKSCIPDRGLPGTFKDRFPGEKGIGKLKTGSLSRYGYDPDYDELTRHTALQRAAQKYGALTLFRKLNAVAVLTRNTDPYRSTIYLADRDWVKYMFM